MFSLILKNMGHKSTLRPLMLQTRNFKRDIGNYGNIFVLLMLSSLGAVLLDLD